MLTKPKTPPRSEAWTRRADTSKVIKKLETTCVTTTCVTCNSAWCSDLSGSVQLWVFLHIQGTDEQRKATNHHDVVLLRSTNHTGILQDTLQAVGMTVAHQRLQGQGRPYRKSGTAHAVLCFRMARSCKHAYCKCALLCPSDMLLNPTWKTCPMVFLVLDIDHSRILPHPSFDIRKQQRSHMIPAGKTSVVDK